MTPDRIREIEGLIERLEAPEYWMSGSKDGHEGENDRPREAAYALRQLLEERQWKAISEAPKEFRKRILLCNPDGDIDVGNWDAWHTSDGLHEGWVCNGLMDPLPTHWMPLPAPPLPVPPEEGEGK